MEYFTNNSSRVNMITEIVLFYQALFNYFITFTKLLLTVSHTAQSNTFKKISNFFPNLSEFAETLPKILFEEIFYWFINENLKLHITENISVQFSISVSIIYVVPTLMAIDMFLQI